MGDCASRPTPSEMEAHFSEFNRKNDRYFKTIPQADDQSRLITSETSQKVLETRKLLYEKKYKEYIKKSENLPSQSPGIQEFLIEVQKAVNLDQGTFCFNQKKPFVVVSLEPNGPSQSTFAGDYFRPKWYKMIHFKTLLTFQTIKFEVKLEGSLDSYGSFSIKIKDLSDQNVHQGWFSLNQDKNDSLSIRVQSIYDEKMLYKNFEKKCLDFIEEINEVMRKVSVLTV
jgi:hypothetical protein